MLIGYARASIDDQAAAAQHDALVMAGCERVFMDSFGGPATGATTEQPALAEALRHVGPGDTLVVWRLDRLGHSLSHLIEVVTELERRQIGFRSLVENIDSGEPNRGPNGTTIVHLFHALADFQHELNREQTRAGLQAARARGRRGGRKRKLDTEQKVAEAQALYEDKQISIAEICHILGISRSTLYRYVARPDRAEWHLD